MYEARAVPLALFVVIVLQIVVTPVQNVISRRYESEADWVALADGPRSPRAARGLQGPDGDEPHRPGPAAVGGGPVRDAPDRDAAHRDGGGLAGSQPPLAVGSR